LIPTSNSRDSYEMAVKKQVSFKEELLRKEVEKIYQALEVPVNSRRVHYLVKFGTSVVDDILEAIEERHIDLVISGTQGATGLKRVFFGSNTASLISKSPVSVLAIPAKAKYHPLTEIIYSTDLMNVDQELDRIKSLSKKFHLNFSVLNFISGGLEFPEETDIIRAIKAQKINVIQRKLPFEQPLNLKLKKFMKTRKGAILGMFKESKSFLSQFLFVSNTEDLVYNLDFPLLVTRKQEVLELVEK
jgi:nucleotide-binding universal stress UspA family protein